MPLLRPALVRRREGFFGAVHLLLALRLISNEKRKPLVLLALLVLATVLQGLGADLLVDGGSNAVAVRADGSAPCGERRLHAS